LAPDVHNARHWEVTEKCHSIHPPNALTRHYSQPIVKRMKLHSAYFPDEIKGRATPEHSHTFTSRRPHKFDTYSMVA